MPIGESFVYTSPSMRFRTRFDRSSNIGARVRHRTKTVGVGSRSLRSFGAAHVIARTGIASFTAKRRRYPRARAARFALDDLPQRLPAEWIDPYFDAFTDLHPRSLHHAIVA